MEDKNVVNGETRPDIFPKAAEPIINFWRSTIVDLPAAITADTLKFTAQRLHSQADYFSRVQNCGTIPEVIRLNALFVQQAVSEYGTEAQKFMTDVRDTLLKRVS